MAFTSRWTARMKVLWPHVTILRAFDTDGSPAWEIHLMPRQADIIVPRPKPTAKRRPAPAARAAPTEPATSTQSSPTPGPVTSDPVTSDPVTSDAELPRRPSPYSQASHALPDRFRAPPAVRVYSPDEPQTIGVADLFQPRTAPGPAAALADQSPPVEKVVVEKEVAEQPIVEPSVAEKPVAEKPEPALYTWVELRSGVNGEPDDSAREVSRYMVSIRASIDLDTALQVTAVTAALRRLSQDPEDRQRRDDVITELAAAPGPTRFASTNFDLATLRATADERFLDGLLVIRDQGVHVDEQGLDSHHLSYLITPTAEATRLLELHPELAGSLAKHVCPAPSGAGDGDAFDGLLRALIDEQDQPAGGRRRPPRLLPRERGTVLRIEHLDRTRTATGSPGVRVDRLLAGDLPEPSTPQINEQRQALRPTPERDPAGHGRPRLEEVSLGDYLAALDDGPN